MCEKEVEELDKGYKYRVSTCLGEKEDLTFIKMSFDPDTETTRVIHDGITNEVLLNVLERRLEFLYKKLPDDNTKKAYFKVQEALKLLEDRTADRRARNVEGTSKL